MLCVSTAPCLGQPMSTVSTVGFAAACRFRTATRALSQACNKPAFKGALDTVASACNMQQAVRPCNKLALKGRNLTLLSHSAICNKLSDTSQALAAATGRLTSTLCL